MLCEEMKWNNTSCVFLFIFQEFQSVSIHEAKIKSYFTPSIHNVYNFKYEIQTTNNPNHKNNNNKNKING